MTKCKNCNRVEWYHSKGNMHNYCKQFIPLNNSPDEQSVEVSSLVVKDPDNIARPGPAVDTGSDISLSDKIKYEKERVVELNGDTWAVIQRIEKDFAEAVRKLKEDFKKIHVFNAKGTCIDSAIQSRINYRFGEFK